jgi:hypothetical protein
MLSKDSTWKEFEKIGLEKVKEQIETYLGIQILFENLEKAYEWWNSFHKKFYLIENDAPEGFVSKTSAYVFYLTQLEGKQRNKFLGITDDLYDDVKKANKWYKNISKYVHPDIVNNNSKEIEMAFIKLKKLYDVMIEEDEGKTSD